MPASTRVSAHRTTVRDNELTLQPRSGLWIEKADDVVVQRNVITGLRDVQSSQRGNGVQLPITPSVRVLDNRISFVRDGLYVDVSHHAVFRGNRLHHLPLRHALHELVPQPVEGNESFLNRGGSGADGGARQHRAQQPHLGNSDHGIMLRTMQDSVVENNIVAGNQRGFFIYDVEYVTLRGNLVVDNAVGVHLAAGSTRNTVQGNDFVANREQVRYVGARDEAWGASRGARGRQPLEQLPRLGPRRRRRRRRVPYEANDLIDRLQVRYPAMALLMGSPSVQALRRSASSSRCCACPAWSTRTRAYAPNPNWSPWRGRYFVTRRAWASATARSPRSKA